MIRRQARSEEKSKVLSWQDFPAQASGCDEWGAPGVCPDVSQIAAALRCILESYEESDVIKYLVLPSPMALSGHFHCREEDIYDALKELHRQGYEFEAAGSSGPVTLWDPLIRRRPAVSEEPRPWQVFCQAMLNPIRHPLAG